MFDVLTRQLVAIGDNIAGETTEGATLAPQLHHPIAGQGTQGHERFWTSIPFAGVHVRAQRVQA